MTKTDPRVASTALLSTLLVAFLACGGKAPEPEAALVPPAQADEPSAPTEDAGAPAEPPAPAAAPAPADAGAAPPATGVIGEAQDECTPVGVDFEKRARPALKACYAEAKKKSPNLEGTVKIKITVDVRGKIKSTKVVEKTLPDSVASCMLKAVKATPFPEVEKCWDASIVIPVTFPTPR